VLPELSARLLPMAREHGRVTVAAAESQTQAMGHAKEFFSATVADGELNRERMLIQYRNGTGSMPATEDLIAFAPWVLNRFGHVAIVSEVGPDYIEVVQQNAGPFASTRERFPLEQRNGRLHVSNDRVLGWLRREQRRINVEGQQSP